ncbi:group I intron-associated PD-(D/E)XK endonuclease [Paraflavisolibacter sp. H34]|uniref:group I intron-associated PD-(D/E)XK endonuclease n=1 Tax=Huijunlia imazamoxiresistens TaxID=3127457 RepID=UPI00301AE637
MAELKLEKTQTGIASELYAAGELCRRGYNVTLTFGNTKAIDLLVQKDQLVLKVQVKGIQRKKSICWTLDKTKVTDDIYFVLVNLHVDQPTAKPEFFVFNGKEVKELFLNTIKGGEKRAYLDYNRVKALGKYQDRWGIFGQPESIELFEEPLKEEDYVPAN